MKNILIGIAVLLSLAAVNAFGQDPRETAKINYLISSIETLKGATFLRNGGEHDAKAAADHLRLKLKNAGDRIKTAEDFIRLCGSRSSLTGEAYRIRFADGTTMDSEAFLRNRLKSFPADKP